jgi:hypothetical protein
MSRQFVIVVLDGDSAEVVECPPNVEIYIVSVDDGDRIYMCPTCEMPWAIAQGDDEMAVCAACGNTQMVHTDNGSGYRDWRKK